MTSDKDKFVNKKTAIWTCVWVWLTNTYRKYKDLITLVIIPSVIAIASLLVSLEANKTAQRISSITNRPYVLLENVKFYNSVKKIIKDKLITSIGSEFTIYNNGSLPAWIIGYDIYLKGEKRVILALFSPEDKPTQNFTIGKDKTEGRRPWFFLMQDINEKDGDVAEFWKAKYRLALIIIKYRAIGDTNSNNEFTYWEMFRFDTKYGEAVRIQCGTDALNDDTIKAKFEEQEKRFINEASN